MARPRSDLAAPSASSRSVVLLRAVNVGGHGTVRTADLPGRLVGCTAVNIGAAGSFVVEGPREPSALRRAFLTALGFETDVIVRSRSEFAELRTAAERLSRALNVGEKHFVTFLAATPAARLPFPHLVPNAATWEVRLDALVGRDVLSSWRRQGERRRYYANEVVEKAFRVHATTRGWDTIERIWAQLAAA